MRVQLQLINFMIPNTLLTQLDQLAKSQYKSRSDVLREAARRAVEEARQEERDFEIIAKTAARINMSEEKAIKLVDKVRSELQMNR